MYFLEREFYNGQHSQLHYVKESLDLQNFTQLPEFTQLLYQTLTQLFCLLKLVKF